MSIDCCGTVQSLKVSTQCVKRLFCGTDGAMGHDSAHKGDTGRRKRIQAKEEEWDPGEVQN